MAQATDDTNANPLSGFFWANNPNVNQQLRQRIAMQMMSSGKGKGYPKNIGEGLTAIGDSLGDIGMARMLERGDLGQQAAAQRDAAALQGSDQPPPPSYAPTEDRSPPVTRGTPLADITPPADSAPPAQPPAVAPGIPLARVAGGFDALNAPQAPPQTAALNTGVVSDAPPVGVPPAPPNPAQAQQMRDLIAAKIQARGGVMVPPGTPPPGGPLPNPTQPGADAPLPSAPIASAPPPGGPPVSIRTAPPMPSQLRPMPQLAQNVPPQPVPTPGYVMPDPAQPRAPPIVPLSPLGQRALGLLNANPNNEYYKTGAVGQLYANEAAKQKLQQDQLNEAYKKQIETQAAMQMERQKQLADQAKRIVDIQKTEAEVAQGKVPTIKTVGGQELQYDAATGKWIVPPQAAPADPNAPPNVNLTEPQAKALTFHSWAKQGNAGVTGNDQLLAHGLQQELLGKVPYFGNQAQNDQYRRARNAANNFVLAFMRDTSGAAYGAKEMYDHASALLPKLGDDPKTLADKASMRQSFVDTLYGGLGPGRQIADFYDKKHAAAAQDRQSAIDTEMAGITPKGIGDTKHNVKTGAVRVWNGKNWVEK
jgi:hypothetical protein